MSEDQLKKFYFKILKLLQSKEAGNKISPNKVVEIFRECSNQNTISDLLVKLGLHDVHALVESLRGQDVRTFSTEDIPVESLVIEYLQAIFPILENQLKQTEHHTLPISVRNFLQSLHQQLKLCQDMVSGLQKKDFFPIMNALMEAYPHQNPTLKQTILTTLKKVGKPVVLALVYSLFQNRSSQHKDLPELLREMGSLSIPALCVALQYPEEPVRYSAAEVLEKMRTLESVPSFVESLQDQSWRIRKLAAYSLGELGDDRAINGLVQCLHDKNATVRLEATRSLGKLGNPSILPSLLPLLQDSDWEIRREAVETMASFGKAASAYLAKGLENDSLVVRKISARILAEIGTVEAVPALMKAISDKDISVRERVVIALGRIQGEDALVTLMKALEDKAPLVRFAAVQVIVNVGSRSTLHLLNRALKDSEAIIRQRANLAIQEILKREDKPRL